MTFLYFYVLVEGKDGDSVEIVYINQVFLESPHFPSILLNQQTLSFRMKPNLSLRRFGVMRNLKWFPHFFHKCCYDCSGAKEVEQNLGIKKGCPFWDSLN